MSGDASLAIQAAVYGALAGDPGVTALVSTRIFDHVPEGTAFPYVTIGESTHRDWSTSNSDGMESTITIHSWARGKGRKEVKEIMKAVYDLLHNAKPSISGQTTVLFQIDFSETTLDPDGRTHHGIQRFKILTMEG